MPMKSFQRQIVMHAWRKAYRFLFSTPMSQILCYSNSRPVSSLTAEWHSDDSENMLSGDESDDGDLTDPRDWDSEHSDESEGK